MRAVKYLVTLTVATGLFSVPSVGQLAPLQVEDILAMYTFSEFTPVSFSPDSKRLVYAARDNRKMGVNPLEQFAPTGVPMNGLGADLFVVEVATGGVANLTGGIGNNWAPAWSPDGRYLAFLSDRDGSGQAKLWVSEPATGDMRKESNVTVRAFEKIEWLPNSRQILLTALPANLTPGQFAQRVTEAAPREIPGESEQGVPGSTVVVYRSASSGTRGAATTTQNGFTNLDGFLRDLVLVDVTSGKVQRIDHGHRIAAYVPSPDGSYLAVTIPKRFEKSGSQQILFDLAAFPLGAGEPQILASDVRLGFDGSSFSWAPDSSQLIYQTGGMEATGDCYVVGVKGGPPRNITSLRATPNQIAYHPLWDREGRHVYFLHQDAVWKASADAGTATQLSKIPQHRLIELVAKGGSVFSPDDSRTLLVLTRDDELKQSGFFAVDLDSGKSVKLLQRSQSFFAYGKRHNVSVSPDGKLVAFFLEDAENAQELWLASPNFRDPRRLTHINPQLDKYQMGASRLIEWLSLDGEVLHGALLLPTGYTEARRYPLIVCVYGGELLSNDLVEFGLGSCGGVNMQLFATRGYAVLLPDAPQRLGTPMADLAKTVLPGVDKVAEMGIADLNRLGLMGSSYGGYSVLSLIVQTQRFRAAMAADGYGDIMAAYGQMDKNGSTYNVSVAEKGQGLMGGPPWEFRERYIENSPVFYLDRVDTPLLIVHGADDTAVHSSLADEVFVGLRRLGKEVVYAKYEKESHSSLNWSYANRLDFCNRVISWFEVHLEK